MLAPCYFGGDMMTNPEGPTAVISFSTILFTATPLTGLINLENTSKILHSIPIAV